MPRFCCSAECSSHVVQFCSPLQGCSTSILPSEQSVYLPHWSWQLAPTWLSYWHVALPSQERRLFSSQEISLWVTLSCFNADSGSQTWLMQIPKAGRCEVCAWSRHTWRPEYLFALWGVRGHAEKVFCISLLIIARNHLLNLCYVSTWCWTLI